MNRSWEREEGEPLHLFEKRMRIIRREDAEVAALGVVLPIRKSRGTCMRKGCDRPRPHGRRRCDFCRLLGGRAA
jgi:hypothetical protein